MVIDIFISVNTVFVFAAQFRIESTSANGETPELKAIGGHVNIGQQRKHTNYFLKGEKSNQELAGNQEGKTSISNASGLSRNCTFPPFYACHVAKLQRLSLSSLSPFEHTKSPPDRLLLLGFNVFCPVQPYCTLSPSWGYWPWSLCLLRDSVSSLVSKIFR